MNQYKFRDYEYAQKVYNEGFLSKYQDTEIKLVSLYMRDILGIENKSERKDAIITFCEKNISGYNRASHFKLVNRALNYSCNKSNKLITIDFVTVSKSEIEYIQNQDLTDTEKKVMFTLLVWKKLDKIWFEIKNENKTYDNIFFKGSKAKYQDLKKMSCIKSNINVNSDVIYVLISKGYITSYPKGSIRLDFINKIEYSDDDEIVLEIRTYPLVGYYWDMYNGNNHIRTCLKCDNIFYKTSNNQIYCKDCKGYEKQKTKILTCVDCGKEFEVDSGSRKTRCDDCHRVERKEHNRSMYMKRKS